MTDTTLDHGQPAGCNSTLRISTSPMDLIGDIYGCGATIGHVARILNVSESAVSLWANGHRTPCHYNLTRLQRLHRDLTSWLDDCARKSCGELVAGQREIDHSRLMETVAS